MCRRRSTTISILPPHIDTFGFQIGAALRRGNRQEPDGRRQNDVALVLRHRDGPQGGAPGLGIGKAAGTTLTLITEEFSAPAAAEDDRRYARRRDHQAAQRRPPRRRGRHRRRRGPRFAGRSRGAAATSSATLTAICGSPRSISARFSRRRCTARLRALGLKTTIAAKNIGYELRCADPIPFDMEYTRDLGYCAAKYLLAGGTRAMISMQGGHFVPVPFADMTDPERAGRASASWTSRRRATRSRAAT